MVNLTIDGRPAQVPEGTTILEAARQADIHIPHLCYLKGINEIAACRVCCVEVEGERAMVTACNNPVQEGMAVHTNSPRARSTRRINVELILSQHDCKCATCVRSGNCQLQEIANDLGILELPFEIQLPQGLRKAWTTTFPLFHDYNKCIKCMRCIQVCDKIQSLSIWDVAGTGSRTTIDVSNNRVIKDSDCALCGQCIIHCPVAGLREPDDTDRLYEALADPDKVTLVGEKDVLDTIDAIVLDTLYLQDLQPSQSLTYSVTAPEGTTLAENVGPVTVTIVVTGVTERSVSVTAFNCENVPAGFSAVPVTESLNILLRGLDGEMARITGEDLRVTVDLSGITEPGVHTVPVTVQVANYANVGVKGSYQIVVDVERLP